MPEVSMWILPALLLSIKKLGDDLRHPMKAFEAFEPEKIIKINYLLEIEDFIIDSLPTHIYLIKKNSPLCFVDIQR